MQNPQGYTFIDLFTAGMIVLAGIALVVVLTNPQRSLNTERDHVREEGVKDIAELLLEYRATDPAGYTEILNTLDEQRTIIGNATDCRGSFGVQCADSSTNDTCIDLGFLSELSTEGIPIDPSGEPFSSRLTGYALSKTNDQLIIAACNPEATSNIEIQIGL